jgi:hypothetical protein
MKRLLVTLFLVVIASLTVTPVFAAEGCTHELGHEPAISSLLSHVDHAYEMNHLANRGIYEDLRSTLKRAQSFEQNGQIDLAVRQLTVFVRKLQVAGAVVDTSCAEHLVMHAEHTIAALNGGM